jgi:hypothetical protein
MLATNWDCFKKFLCEGVPPYNFLQRKGSSVNIFFSQKGSA